MAYSIVAGCFQILGTVVATGLYWLLGTDGGRDELKQWLCPCASGRTAVCVTYKARFEWKWADLWVGLFFKRAGNSVDIWLCMLPCIPLHIQWQWHDPAQ